MHYKWSPLPQRKPLRWPNGKRFAVILTINLEHWEMVKESKEPHYAGGVVFSSNDVGRLHREHHAKREVVVYDYVDSGVPMLARMALKRQSGYRSLGYEVAAK